MGQLGQFLLGKQIDTMVDLLSCHCVDRKGVIENIRSIPGCRPNIFLLGKL